MLRKILVFLPLLFILASAANAQANVALTLRNLNTNEIVDGVVVYLDLNEQKLIRYVEHGELLEMSLDDGSYSLVLGIDDPSTPGKDYFKKETINVLGGLAADAYLFPVSSLRGIVKDVFDNVVGEASLKFECSNDINADFPLSTDEFGTFAADYIPSGSCKISANFGEAVGFANINVSHGEIMDVEIILDRTILAIPKSSSGIKGIVAALLIIIVVLLFARHKNKQVGRLTKKRKGHEEMPEAEEEASGEEKKKEIASTRAEDIKPTLNKKERDIVDFLLKHKDEISQASIRHNLGIPRTSLSRIIASLEQKNIINVRKVGKAVKIKLTDWFLGKE